MEGYILAMYGSQVDVSLLKEGKELSRGFPIGE